VSLVDSGQSVPERGSWTVGIQLSEPSLLEVSVPYVIASDSTAALGTDFTIADDVVTNGVTTVKNSSPIIFAPGETFKQITFSVINDSLVEEDEFIYFDLVGQGLTVAQLGEQTRHTVRIIDNDPVRAFFRVHEGEFYENSNITVSVVLSEPVNEDVTIQYTTTLITANDRDVSASDSFSTRSPITIAAGSSAGSIALRVLNDSVTDRNEGGADRETLSFTLTSARLASGRDVDFDTRPYVATIIDNDPISVELSYPDDTEFPIDIQEYQTASFRVVLRDPYGNLTTANDVIEIPVTYGGTATIGSGANDDANPEASPLKIPADQSSATFSLNINNDDNVEGDEILTIALGQPKYVLGGDVVLGAKNQMSFRILDNDPVTLGFGAVYSKDDKLAAEDPDYVNILYVESAGSVAARQWGSATIPIFLSSPSANNAEFKIQLLADGTNAVPFDQKQGSDQEWDFAVTSHNLAKPGDSASVVIRAGMQAAGISVALNNNNPEPSVLGGTSTAKPDRVVRFRITELNTTTSKINPGKYLDYTLTIRDLPDIDITSAMTGLSPLQSSLVNGGLRFSQKTGLFEADYLIRPNRIFSAAEFAGYQSMKFRYRTTNFDASNPSASGNDPLIQSPLEPGPGEEFHFFVNPPYQLRYPHASQQIKLIEGAEPVDRKFDITTADTIETAPYLLRPLSLPRLNDFEADLEGAFDMNDELRWTVPFYSLGYFHFPVDRIDPAVNPERLRVFLTVEGTATLADSGSTAAISRFEPQADGSMFMVIESGAGSNSVQIQYLDPGDEWRVAHPENMSTGGASKFYWIDNGPPQTQTHPANVPFRLYRAIRN
jgi:hypothetical protein